MHALTQPWSHPFMQRALLEVLIISIPPAAKLTIRVARQMSTNASATAA